MLLSPPGLPVAGPINRIEVVVVWWALASSARAACRGLSAQLHQVLRKLLRWVILLHAEERRRKTGAERRNMYYVVVTCEGRARNRCYSTPKSCKHYHKPKEPA